jgi:predicted acyltransferase
MNTASTAAVSTRKISQRLVSLDVFRGITIAGMILVNHPGSWSVMYQPLGHARWHGWTPTDLVFPFFLFIVGVAMTFSFDKRISLGHSKVRLFEQVVRRSVQIYCVGMIMYALPDLRLAAPYIFITAGLGFLFYDEPPFVLGETANIRARKIGGWFLTALGLIWFAVNFPYFNDSGLRVVGVLQRIAICYFVASLILMTTGVRGRIAWAAALLIGYWAILQWVPPPASYMDNVLKVKEMLAQDPDAWKTNELAAFYRHSINVLENRPLGMIGDWLDMTLLGNHLYRERPDPEGLLSTIPAIATVILGILTGSWLRSDRDKLEKLCGLFFMANILLFIGICWDYSFPINKKIWTSSYVVFTAGMALHFLGMCFWLVDVKNRRKWAVPFLVFGTNAITVYFLAHLGSKFLGRWKLEAGGSAYSWLYQNLFASWAGPLNGSLLFAITYVLIWLLLMIPLYRKRIFIKI